MALHFSEVLHRLVLVLIILVCVSHGRRIHAPSGVSTERSVGQSRVLKTSETGHSRLLRTTYTTQTDVLEKKLGRFASQMLHLLDRSTEPVAAFLAHGLAFSRTSSATYRRPNSGSSISMEEGKNGRPWLYDRERTFKQLSQREIEEARAKMEARVSGTATVNGTALTWENEPAHISGVLKKDVREYMDGVVSQVMQMNEDDLIKVVQKNYEFFNQVPMFLHLAEKADGYGMGTKEYDDIVLLSTRIMYVVDEFWTRAGAKANEFGDVLQEAIKCAADKDGELLAPVPLDMVVKMSDFLIPKLDELNDDAFVGLIEAYMNQANEDGYEGLVEILRTVLQVYSAETLIVSMKNQTEVAFPENVEDAVRATLLNPPHRWEDQLRFLCPKLEVSPSSIKDAIGVAMADLISGSDLGSVPQGVKAEMMNNLRETLITMEAEAFADESDFLKRAELKPAETEQAAPEQAGNSTEDSGFEDI